MTDDPLAWHSALMAERVAEFYVDAPEAPFFQREIARFGQPALDLACGAGRVLLPLLRAGVEIDGCDVSAELLQQCRAKAAREGYEPRLYQQPMHAFALPRRYRTIYICNSFGLTDGRDQDMAALRQCHAHLEDGGALLVNIEAAYTSQEEWELWEPVKRRALPEPWPEEGRRRVAADGSVHVDRLRAVAMDPLEQRWVRELRLEKWVAGRLVASEELALRGNVYLKNELVFMLQAAGFRDITVRGDYTDEPATPDSKELVLTVVK